MRLKPTTIRGRLTASYAAVLLAILVLLSAGIYQFVRISLERSMAAQFEHDFGTVATVVAASPKGKGSGGHLPGDVMFMVMDGPRVLYHSESWCNAKFLTDIFSEPPGSAGVWRSIQGRPHRLMVRTLNIQGRELKATVAEDTSVLNATLRSLLRLLLLSIPCAAILSVGCGYLLAGRALAPVRAMAAKSREITAEALSERLPVGNPEDELGRMAVVFNETLARLESSFERLRNFTANVSHELRTPLTAIRSVGEVGLRRAQSAEQLRDVVGSMLEEVYRLTRLIDCLLALARTESGRLRQPGADLDLAAEAGAAFELVRVLAEEKGQTACFQSDEGAIVRGDAAMLRQAVLNLLDNAIRYTPNSGLVKLTVRRTSHGEAVVEVEDNGPGIPPADRARVFDRFHRASPDVPGAARGAGLGLAIARHAVEASGGRLEYEAVAAGGSKFRITLPARTE